MIHIPKRKKKKTSPIKVEIPVPLVDLLSNFHHRFQQSKKKNIKNLNSTRITDQKPTPLPLPKLLSNPNSSLEKILVPNRGTSLNNFIQHRRNAETS